MLVKSEWALHSMCGDGVVGMMVNVSDFVGLVRIVVEGWWGLDPVWEGEEGGVWETKERWRTVEVEGELRMEGDGEGFVGVVGVTMTAEWWSGGMLE